MALQELDLRVEEIWLLSLLSAIQRISVAADIEEHSEFTDTRVGEAGAGGDVGAHNQHSELTGETKDASDRGESGGRRKTAHRRMDGSGKANTVIGRGAWRMGTKGGMTRAELESMREAITHPGLLGFTNTRAPSSAPSARSARSDGAGDVGEGRPTGGHRSDVAREKTLYIEVIRLHPVCINITFTQDPDVPLAGQLVPANMNGPLSNMLRVFINTFGAMLGNLDQVSE